MYNFNSYSTKYLNVSFKYMSNIAHSYSEMLFPLIDSQALKLITKKNSVKIYAFNEEKKRKMRCLNSGMTEIYTIACA